MHKIAHSQVPTQKQMFEFAKVGYWVSFQLTNGLIIKRPEIGHLKI